MTGIFGVDSAPLISHRLTSNYEVNCQPHTVHISHSSNCEHKIALTERKKKNIGIRVIGLYNALFGIMFISMTHYDWAFICFVWITQIQNSLQSHTVLFSNNTWTKHFLIKKNKKKPWHIQMCACVRQNLQIHTVQYKATAMYYSMPTVLWLKYCPIETSYLNVREHVVCDETLLWTPVTWMLSCTQLAGCPSRSTSMSKYVAFPEKKT